LGVKPEPDDGRQRTDQAFFPSAFCPPLPAPHFNNFDCGRMDTEALAGTSVMRESEPRLTHLRVGGWARKLIDFLAGRRFEPTDIKAVVQDQFGAHQAHQVQDRRNGGPTRFGKVTSDVRVVVSSAHTDSFSRSADLYSPRAMMRFAKDLTNHGPEYGGHDFGLEWHPMSGPF
jgi:hypothetical protein